MQHITDIANIADTMCDTTYDRTIWKSLSRRQTVDEVLAHWLHVARYHCAEEVFADWKQAQLQDQTRFTVTYCN